MTELARHEAQPTGPVASILSKGEMHEGGYIVGVYLDRDLAHGDFVREAQQIHDRFGIDDLTPDTTDGSIRLHGGCDWLALEPHPLITSAQLA
jgi:hypothetical protein